MFSDHFPQLKLLSNILHSNLLRQKFISASIFCILLLLTPVSITTIPLYYFPHTENHWLESFPSPIPFH